MILEASLSNEIPFGVAVNALAHASLGIAAKAKLAGILPTQNVLFFGTQVRFELLVTSINLHDVSGAQILLEQQSRSDLPGLYVDFVDTMTGDTYVEQLEKTKAKTTKDLKYYAMVSIVQ